MTTPQNQLYNLADQIKQLRRMFTPEMYGDEAELSIFDKIDDIHKAMALIVSRHEKIEDQMALIIKLLSKE